jgi:enoyl-CoA hydratase
MSSTTVRATIDNGVAWITLDGEHTRNALDAEASAALVATCDDIDADPSVGAVVITGAGRTFCSGADTDVLHQLRTARPDEAYEGLDALYAAFRRVGRLTVPSLAAINGAAVGAGLNLALSTDLRLMADSAVLISGFDRIGLHPGGGHLHLLARAGGPGLSAAAAVFAQSIDARAALRTGLVWGVVSAAELPAIAADTVAHLGADPSLARALAATLRRTVADDAAWDRAVEVERARQMWSLTRPTRER